MVKQEATVEKDVDTAWDIAMRYFDRNDYKVKSQTPKKQLMVEKGSKAKSIFSGGLPGGGFDLDYRTITVNFTPVGANSTRLLINAKFTWITAGKAGRKSYLKSEIEWLLKDFDEEYQEEFKKKQEGRAEVQEKLQSWAVKPIRIITGHGPSILSCAFSPDGTQALSASYNGTLRLWDVKTGTYFRIFKGHKKPVTSCAFSSDGTRIVSASKDKLVILWDVKSGKRLKVFKGHVDDVNKCRFSPDDTRIISCSDDKTLILWDVESGKRISTLEGHNYRVKDCVFSTDGSSILSASTENTLRLWDAQTGKLIKTFNIEEREGLYIEDQLSCTISPDGATVVGGSSKNNIRFWDVATGQLKKIIEAEVGVVEGESEWTYACTFSNDGSLLFACFGNGVIRVWDARTHDGIKVMKISGFLRDFALSPDGSLLLCGGGGEGDDQGVARMSIIALDLKRNVCSECGRTLIASDKFCPSCGNKV
ncbi:MAG: hypothetical protein HWN65_06425 [Candidatus Helarchaeota archaeon]|nr:hypothetical protein [Candidatus Helarchaeota archaeon]